MLPNRQIAKTTFEAGPEEKLAAVDVYGIKTEEVINTAPLMNLDFLDKVKSSAADEMRGGKSMLSKLPSFDKTNGLGGLLDKAKSIGSKSLSAVGGVNGLAKAVGPSLLARVGSSALSGIPGLYDNGLASLASKLGSVNLPGNVKKMLGAGIQSRLGSYASVGGVISKLATNEVARAYNLSSVINSLGVGSVPLNIIDRDSTSRLISTLAIGGMQAGLPNVFGEVISLAGGDKKIVSSAAHMCLDYASKTGNLSGMKDIVLKSGKPAVASMGKKVMKSLASNFTLPAGPDETKTQFTKVTDTFKAIDTKWASEERLKINTDTQLPEIDYLVADISIAREGNSEFRNLMRQGALTTTDPELKYFAAVTAFPVRTPEEELRRSFPLTYTTVDTRTTPQVETAPVKGYALPALALGATLASENYSISMEELRARSKSRRDKRAEEELEEDRDKFLKMTPEEKNRYLRDNSTLT